MNQMPHQPLHGLPRNHRPSFQVKQCRTNLRELLALRPHLPGVAVDHETKGSRLRSRRLNLMNNESGRRQATHHVAQHLIDGVLVGTYHVQVVAVGQDGRPPVPEVRARVVIKQEPVCTDLGELEGQELMHPLR